MWSNSNWSISRRDFQILPGFQSILEFGIGCFGKVLLSPDEISRNCGYEVTVYVVSMQTNQIGLLYCQILGSLKTSLFSLQWCFYRLSWVCKESSNEFFMQPALRTSSTRIESLMRYVNAVTVSDIWIGLKVDSKEYPAYILLLLSRSDFDCFGRDIDSDLTCNTSTSHQRWTDPDDISSIAWFASATQLSVYGHSP